MAVHTGKEGTVKVGSAAIAEIRNYSYEEVGDTVETTALGDTARTFEPTLTSWTGNVDVWYDETDTTGQGALTVGSEVTVVFAPEGDDTTGDISRTGTAIVTGHSVTTAFDGAVEASITLQGKGALSVATTA